jgi:O-antigen/teichoic acid export membrane protein
VGGELRDKVASGVAWSIAEKVGSMLLQMGVSIVILRLLTPEQMGIMAIPVVFSSLALVMVDSGFSQTLIRKAVPSEEDYKSVFVFNIAVSVLLYLRAFEDGDFASAWGIGAVLLVLVLLINLAARLAKTKLKQKQ